MHRRKIESGGLTLFLALVTIALACVLFSFAGALLWAFLAAMVFQPLFHRLLDAWPGRPTLAAAATLLLVTILVVIPTLIVASLVVEQAVEVYARLRGRQINFPAYFAQFHDALPLRP